MHITLWGGILFFSTLSYSPLRYMIILLPIAIYLAISAIHTLTSLNQARQLPLVGIRSAFFVLVAITGTLYLFKFHRRKDFKVINKTRIDTKWIMAQTTCILTLSLEFQAIKALLVVSRETQWFSPPLLLMKTHVITQYPTSITRSSSIAEGVITHKPILGSRQM